MVQKERINTIIYEQSTENIPENTDDYLNLKNQNDIPHDGKKSENDRSSIHI